jgi:hypothetical protein
VDLWEGEEKNAQKAAEFARKHAEDCKERRVNLLRDGVIRDRNKGILAAIRYMTRTKRGYTLSRSGKLQQGTNVVATWEVAKAKSAVVFEEHSIRQSIRSFLMKDLNSYDEYRF